MNYSLSTFVKYIFGSKPAAKKLFTGITPKKLVEYHFFNILLSSVFVLISSNLAINLINADPNYDAFREYFTINTWTIFAGYIPSLILTYILFTLALIALGIIYFAIARLFKSSIALKTSIYAFQFNAILHPLAHAFFLALILSITLGIAQITLILFYLLLPILFFTLSKQYAQLAGLTTITIFLFNILILGVFAAILYLVVSSMLPI
jgi:hypothetical protein